MIKTRAYFKHNSTLKLVEAEGNWDHQTVLEELKASSLKPDDDRVMCVYVNDDKEEKTL